MSRKGIDMPVSDSERAARRIRGCMGAGGAACPGGVVLWTEQGTGEYKADAGELSEDLMLLGVPHFTTLTGRCQPPWRSAATKVPLARWEKIWFIGDDFQYLIAAIPTLAGLADQVEPLPEPLEVEVRLRSDGTAFYAVGGEQLANMAGSCYLGELPPWGAA